MKSMKLVRPLLKIGLFGLGLLPFMYLMNHFSPPPAKAPVEYGSVILAFEFASNEEELKEVLMPLSETERLNIDRVNYVDFGFMIFYGLFLYLFLSRSSLLSGSSLLAKSKWLVPVVVISDFFENWHLLKLSKYNIDLDLEVISYIKGLAFFTWTKWLLLAVVFAILGYEMIRTRMPYKLIGLPLLIPFLLGLYAFFTGNPRVEDLFATSVFGNFFLIFIYCFVYRK